MWPEPALVIRVAFIGWLSLGVMLMVALAFIGKPPDPDAVLA